MYRTLAAAALAAAAAVVVPASSAHAACVLPVTNPDTGVCVESEGVSSPPGGGVTSASTIWVWVNGNNVLTVCLGRVTVTSGGTVTANPPRTC